MRFVLYLLLLMGLALGACSDDSSPIVTEMPEDVVWEPQALPVGAADQWLMSLKARTDDLFVLGRDFFTTVGRDGKAGNVYTHGTLDIPTGRALPFVNEDYFVYPMDINGFFAHNSLNINWSVTGNGLPTSVQLPLSTLDPALSEDARCAAWDTHTAVAVINEDGLMLVPVFDAGPGPGTLYLEMVRLSPRAPGDFSEITATLERKVPWPYEPVWVMTADNRFFASTVLATYEVQAGGAINQIFDEGVLRMIAHENRLYASNWSGVYVSGDGGATWERVTSALTGDLFVVDGKLCLLSGAQIEFIDEGAGRTVALADAGLPGENGIWTSAAQLGDRVYVATRKGLFAKPVSHFFETRAVP